LLSTLCPLRPDRCLCPVSRHPSHPSIPSTAHQPNSPHSVAIVTGSSSGVGAAVVKTHTHIYTYRNTRALAHTLIRN
jgi:hypothetical protein